MFERSLGVAARRRRTLDALVRHVAEASVDAICRLVEDRIEAMGPCEARGYVRARAAREIRQQPGVDASWELLVVVRSTERVVPLAMRQLAAMRISRQATTERRAA
jgi:hypothetical protein